MNKQAHLHIATITFLCTSIILYFIFFIPEADWKPLAADDGIIQQIGTVLIVSAYLLAVFFLLKEKHDRRFWLLVSYLLLIYACREADFHRTACDVVKITKFAKFYSHPEVALWFKVFIFTIEALILYSIYWLIQHYGRFFLQQLKLRAAWALGVAFWFIVFFLSQIMDQLHHYVYASRVIEESLETTAELIAIYIVLRLFIDKVTEKKLLMRAFIKK